MPVATVKVPATLLLARSLSPAAQLVWMVLHLHAPAAPSQLAASGLSRPTVLKALSQLAASGWCTAVAGGYRTAIRRPTAATAQASAAGAAAARGAPLATIPAALLADRRTGIRGKILYGILQLAPSFRTPSVPASYAAVGELAGACGNTVKRAGRNLVAAGWLHTNRVNRLARVQFTLLNPAIARGEADRAKADRRLYFAGYKGEAIMQEYLSLLLDSDEFEDNARPGFLVNPQTEARMELDRYYPAGLAFEFNGAQHDGATESVSAEEAAGQQARDYMKLGICTGRGIPLVVVHAGDLSLETMQRKVRAALEDRQYMRRPDRLLPQDGARLSMARHQAGGLPRLRDLTGYEPLIELLESSSQGYRAKARGGG